MVARVDTARVMLWGEPVGAVSWLADRGVGLFEFEPAFLQKGLDIAPIHMSVETAQQGDGLFSFSALTAKRKSRGLAPELDRLQWGAFLPL